MTTSTTLKIDLSKVMTVYSGKDGKCCCGCSGKHTVASAFAAAHEATHGYACRPEDVSDRTVKTIVGKMERAVETGAGVLEDCDDSMVSVVVGGRLYIAYLLDQDAADKIAAFNTINAKKSSK